MIRALSPHAHHLDILAELTRKEIRLRYKSSVLGYAWSMLNPIVLAAVFFLAFRVIMRVKIDNYALFVLSGLFPWQWFANSIQASTQVYITNAQLVKKVRFRWELLPLATVLNDGFHLVATLPIIAGLTLLHDRVPGAAWLYGLPLLVATQAVIVYGFALIGAAVNLFFRDVERLSGILVMILFYLTPLVYSLEMVPEAYRWLLTFNPMAPLIHAYRSLFMDNLVAWPQLGVSAALGAALLCFGLFVHRRLEWRFNEAL